MPSIEEFDAYVQQLAAHDWYYDFSDDSRVYRAGRIAKERLSAQAQRHEFYQKAFKAWCDYEFNRIDDTARDKAIAALRQAIQPVTV